MSRTWIEVALGVAAVALGLRLLGSISFESVFAPSSSVGPEPPNPESSPMGRAAALRGGAEAPRATMELPDTSEEGPANSLESRAQLLEPPAAGTWEAAPLLRRVRALGRAGADLDEVLRLAISPCLSLSPSALRGAALILQIEANSGELRVSGSSIEEPGELDQALLACAQKKVRGLRVSTAATAPAPRFRLRYRLSP